MVWYDVPGCPSIQCNEFGEIRSSRTHRPRAKTYKRKGGRPKLNVCEGRIKRTLAVARIVLSAKLGRPLYDWEDACHIDGNPLNDSMNNLKAGSRVNNVIDEYVLGRLPIPPDEEIDIAIARLQSLKNFGSKI